MAVKDEGQRVPVNEAALMAWVRDLAHVYGWLTYHTRDSRGSDPGFPDLVLVRPPRLVFVELKTTGRHPTRTQAQWLGDLDAVSDAIRSRGTGRVEVYVWRPENMAGIERILKR